MGYKCRLFLGVMAGVLEASRPPLPGCLFSFSKPFFSHLQTGHSDSSSRVGLLAVRVTFNGLYTQSGTW